MLDVGIGQILTGFRQVYHGRKRWRQLIREYGVDLDMDFVILLPKGNDRCNYYVMLYLNRLIMTFEQRKTFLQHHGHPIIRRNEKFFILTNDDNVMKSAKTICRRITEVIPYSEQEIQELLKYYLIYPFTGRLIIGMVDGIVGRNSCRPLEQNGITLEELVANGIFNLRIEKFNRITRPAVPTTAKMDQNVLDYINVNDIRRNYG